VWNRVKLIGIKWNCVGTDVIVWKWFKLSGNTKKRVELCESNWKRVELCKSNKNCVEMCGNV